MGKLYDSVTPELVEFIARQHMFFVATADASGRVNVSPKGLDSFRVLGPNRVAWLNGTGSGNETAAHLAMVNRMTIMMCAFEGKPWILRLYGTARTIQPGDPDWEELLDLFVPFPGARQVFDMTVDSAQTSCGFGVPFYDYVGQR
ncbi:MAG TPA: pyridoxamine 5'-phosphate oxidase, partial [Propionibacteriaceae bacterium]|nr:pyridoxamine 5'-phosphate oxidase [Propionibacteriaceae bacterium]